MSTMSSHDYSTIDWTIDSVHHALLATVLDHNGAATPADRRRVAAATFAAVNVVFGADHGGAWTPDELAERVAAASLAATFAD